MRSVRLTPGILGLVVFAVALWAQADALVGVFFDDGVYTVLARALAEGEGYRNIHLPGSPPGVHYPPLYPAILGMIWWIWPVFPENVMLFNLLNAAALGAAAALMARHLEVTEEPGALCHLALVVGFTAFPLLTLVGVTFSEPVFLALVAGAALIADRKRVLSGRSALLLGVLLGLTVLTRTIGLAVAAGMIAGLWFRGARRALLPALTALAVTIAPWFVWVALNRSVIDPHLAANYGSYLSEAKQAGLGAFLAGLDFRVFGPMSRLFLPRLPAPMAGLLAVGLTAVLLWGGWRLARRAPSLVVSLAAYLVAATLWPFAPDRFVWAVLPWLLVLAAAGFRDLSRRSRAGRVATVILAGVALIGFVPREVASLQDRRFEGANEGISRLFELMLPSIVQELPENAVIATDDEALVFLYTGRRTLPRLLFRWEGRTTAPFSESETRRFHCEMGATHVLRISADPDNESSDAPDPASVLVGIRQGPTLTELQCSG